MTYKHEFSSDDWFWLDELGELDPSFIEAIQQLRAASNHYHVPERARGEMERFRYSVNNAPKGVLHTF